MIFVFSTVDVWYRYTNLFKDIKCGLCPLVADYCSQMTN